jgi:hypothetical protein
MKRFIEAVKSAVGNHSGIFVWKSGKGFTISEPSNYDLGTEVTDMAKELNLNIRINSVPQPNPKGGFFRAGISISKVATATDDELCDALS